MKMAGSSTANNNNTTARRSNVNARSVITFCTGFVTGIFLSSQAFYDYNVTPLQVVDPAPSVTTTSIAINVNTHEAPSTITVQENVTTATATSDDSSSSNITESSFSSASSPHAHNMTIFPNSMRHLVTGMARVSRNDFGKQFDIGFGLDESEPHNNEVLLLYGSEQALPVHYDLARAEQQQQDGIGPFQTLEQATENCDIVKVVLTDPKPIKAKNKKEGEHKQCIAVMGQWDSYHVHKFERSNSKNNNQLVYKEAHHRSDPPSREETKASQQALLEFLTVYEDALEKLRPIAEKVSQQIKGPIIVMVANYGQAQFFVNFMCAAVARKLDTSRVLLFATDQETYDLATSMGVAVFYDQRIFKSIPRGAAKDYHDINYGRIMMSKVYCVHLINALGYDLLFQDLDLVWYRDPLPYFEQKTLAAAKDEGEQDFDMYFQHDGIHHPERFAPLAANTGFYYVRHNARTEHFFSVFVRMGDLVITDRSHQAALTTLVNELMSLRGLRVKVLAEDSDLFLSGFHRHARPRTVKQTVQGNHKPYLFHVNWMSGNEKQPVLKETLNWFVQDQCPGKDPSLNMTKNGNGGDYFASCCLAEPARPDNSPYFR